MDVTFRNNIVKSFLKGINLPFTLVLPSGIKYGSSTEAIVIFKTWKSVFETLVDTEMGFCENYAKGEIEVEGNLEKVIEFGISFKRRKTIKDLYIKLIDILYGLNPANKQKDSENIKYHYDIDDDFYKEWLDESMTYSCAFFESNKVSLEEAQRKKREIIYEKLKLKEGDRLLDIGCGWGSIIIESAEKFGVKSVGITLSENQYKFIKDRIREKGLEGKVEVYLMHYKDLPSLGRRFNKIVSVGMFEHVGKNNINIFFNRVKSVSEEGALFLLHTIGKPFESSQSRWIRRRIFPGGYIPGLNEILKSMVNTGFNLIDIDNWRLHYYLTLREWHRRFNEKREIFERKYGTFFVRMWNLYLVSAGVSFLVGSNHLFQILMSKGVNNHYPVILRKYGNTLNP